MVRCDATTMSVPPVSRSSSTASTTGTTGGLSIRMKSNSWASLSKSSRIGSEPSSSLGFGGIAPDVSTCRLVSRQRWITSVTPAWPSSTVVRPAPPSMPSVRATDGLRRSPSISRTLPPVVAIAMARLTVVVVLPSPGIAEVTMKECRPVVTSTNIRLVRSRRMASA